jgi:hypothetical protein
MKMGKKPITEDIEQFGSRDVLPRPQTKGVSYFENNQLEDKVI